jgi:hypothetical protein
MQDSWVLQGNTRKKGGGDQGQRRRWTFYETFEKCSILFKFKEGEDFNRRNTVSILRIEI